MALKKSKSSVISPPFDLGEIFARPERVLGIDPGLSGAVAQIHRGVLEVRRDFKELEDIADAVVFSVGQEAPAGIFVESVHAMPGQGVCSMFNFGDAFGVAKGAVWACGHPVTLVTPQKWQNWFREILHMGREPFESAEIAAGLFPEQAGLFKRKLDHGSGDAVLLAIYGLSTLS